MTFLIGFIVGLAIGVVGCACYSIWCLYREINNE
jgi:hypothetical protein